jgi:hypothetical protein
LQVNGIFRLADPQPDGWNPLSGGAFTCHASRKKDEAMPLLWFFPMIMLSAMFDLSSGAARARQNRHLAGGLSS